MTGKKYFLYFLFLFSFMTVAGTVYCADIQLSSDVSATKISLDDRIVLTVTVSGSDAMRAGDPVLKAMPDFSTDEAGTSTSVNIINGKTSASKEYTYLLFPRKTGIFDVGAATLKMGSYLFSAPAKKVEVVQGSPGSGSRQTGQSSQPGQPQQQSGQNVGVPSGGKSGNNDIFIKTTVDKKSCYVGEQITLAFELYNRLTLFGDSQYGAPSTTGFWSKSLPDIPPSTKNANGRVYQYNAVKTALFPTSSGTQTIGPATLSFNYGGFFQPVRKYTLETDPIKINVKELPETDKPQTFSGGVGNFSITAKADKTTLKAGDVLTISVSVAGKGNIDLISKVNEPNFSSFKTYDPKPKDTIYNSGDEIGGSKTWEYMIIPKLQGAAVIGPFSLSFFDPAEGKYKTVATEQISLNVLPGDASSMAAGTPGETHATVENIAMDIRFIKPDKTVLKNSDSKLYGNFLFYLIYILPIGLFVSCFIIKRRNDIIEKNTGLKRRLNAWKKAQKGIEDALKIIQNRDPKNFCGKIHDTLIVYIGDMLNLETGSLSSAGIEDILRDKGLSEDISGRIRKLLEMCDFVSFSSSGNTEQVQENIMGETKNVLEELRGVL